MLDRRNEPRMLCADLVDVQWSDAAGRTKKGVANLEDIAPTGACIQMDAPLPLKTVVDLRYPAGKLTGIVTRCEYREIGYFIGIEFDEQSSWSQTRFKPQHLLDPRRIAVRSPAKVKDIDEGKATIQ